MSCVAGFHARAVFGRVLLSLLMGLGLLFHGAVFIDMAIVSIAMMVSGVTFLVTGLIGICPMYRILGIKKDQPC